MRWFGLTLVIGLLLAFASSCALNHPKSLKETQKMKDVRMEYIESNPKGQYNDHIQRGELAKGMSVIEVLASWGLPSSRQHWRSTDKESWTYYSFDPHTKDATIYELMFEARTLTKWVMHKQVAAAGGVPEEQQPASPTPDAGAGSADPKKKKR